MTITRVLLQPIGHHAAGEHDPEQDLLSRESNVTAQSRSQVLVESPFGRKVSEASKELLKAINVESQKDIQWYFEDYVISEPFARARAQAIRRKLRKQGQQLLRHYLQPEIHLDDEYPTEFLIEVRNGHSNAAVAHALHQFSWEILEDTNLWQDVFQAKPRKVTVIRVHGNVDLREKPSYDGLCCSSSNLQATNVLAITARPSHTKDIPHRLITRSISSAIDAIRERSASAATLRIVRPGTFKALKHHLEQCRPGHFRVAHLDLHGDADGTG